MIDKQAFIKRVRESEELGRNSCSHYDECFTDEEVLILIDEELIDNPNHTEDTLFAKFVQNDKDMWEHERELSIGYGGGEFMGWY